MSPPTKVCWWGGGGGVGGGWVEGEGDILLFGMDPVGIGVSVKLEYPLEYSDDTW